MAKSQSTTLLPSWAVLGAGIACGLVASLLAVWYVQSAVSDVRGDPIYVVKVTRPVRVGEPILRSQVERVAVPRYFEEAFENAVKYDRDMSMIEGTDEAPRALREGQILFYSDIAPESRDAELPLPRTGRVHLSVNVDETEVKSLGIQKGTRVNLSAIIDTNPDEREETPRSMDIVRNARVVQVGPRLGGKKRYDPLILDLPKEIADRMRDVEARLMLDDEYRIELPAASRFANVEAEFNPDVSKFLNPSPTGF